MISGQLCFQTDIRKWLCGTSFLDSHFKNHPNVAILQKCQSLSNQSYKRNLVHKPLNLTLRFLSNQGFLCSSWTLTRQKTNVCSPWTPCQLWKKYQLLISNTIEISPSVSESNLSTASEKNGVYWIFSIVWWNWYKW